jgi:hypothetical protein
MREARQYAGGGAWLGNALGQTVSVDLRRGVVSGRISRIDSAVVDGTVTVEAKLEGDLPATPRPGAAVDGTIQIAMLNDVVYVGRPAVGAADSEGSLFRVEPDGEERACGRGSGDRFRYVEVCRTGSCEIAATFALRVRTS